MLNLIKFMGAADEQTLLGDIYLQIQMAGMVIFALTSTYRCAAGSWQLSNCDDLYLTSNAVNVFLITA